MKREVGSSEIEESGGHGNHMAISFLSELISTPVPGITCSQNKHTIVK